MPSSFRLMGWLDINLPLTSVAHVLLPSLDMRAWLWVFLQLYTLPGCSDNIQVFSHSQNAGWMRGHNPGWSAGFMCEQRTCWDRKHAVLRLRRSWNEVLSQPYRAVHTHTGVSSYSGWLDLCLTKHQRVSEWLKCKMRDIKHFDKSQQENHRCH